MQELTFWYLLEYARRLKSLGFGQAMRRWALLLLEYGAIGFYMKRRAM